MKVTLCQAVGGSVGETIEREDGEWLVSEGYATKAQDSTSGSAKGSTSQSATNSEKSATHSTQSKSAKAKA